ncbi:hypothetical protein ACUH7Y_12790 [Clostridium beijerinckii]|jgi:hypothetical protein|uniref:Uncharacterized protein n=3 Tax=Clostridium TaxID=1485 RepID=A0A1S8NZV2_CLOBE|nr:hypothetical protein [Clostridium beijerinckii]GEA32360.1 hypothetical protein CDIOL_32830 [Clostridium diolis]NMF04494.1 hypothetical protein [Clostridium beijerinckii]NRY63463.1 hypothetical protein [Clostridium beijerinckii]NRZ26974.1 hypothetical protein [Clostridium beijerinckii]NYB97231.1 hypothetical protein [Clostridium beijerinckii]
MNRKLLQDYQKRILWIIKALGEKNSLNIPEIEIDESPSSDIGQKNVIISLNKLK